MKITNYKGKTNEELAIDFLKSMVEKEKKTNKHFQILLKKYKAYEVEGVEDLVNATVEKVYNTIMRKGFKDGFFQAYFETALENNLLQFLKKESLEISCNAFCESTSVDDEEAEMELQDYEQDRLDKMMFAFNQLPESSKEMLYMITDSQKYKETQRSLGLTEGQVKMRTRKARAQVVEYQNLYPIKTWEVLKEVKGYSVSRLGQIRDDVTGKILKVKIRNNDYQYVLLPNSVTGELEKYVIHELVYKYHGDEHSVKGYIYHIDKNIKNNHIDNLLFDSI
jgi:RNA polymerase sigma factor (sigma-70 family)